MSGRVTRVLATRRGSTEARGTFVAVIVASGTAAVPVFATEPRDAIVVGGTSAVIVFELALMTSITVKSTQNLEAIIIDVTGRGACTWIMTKYQRRRIRVNCREMK